MALLPIRYQTNLISWKNGKPTYAQACCPQLSENRYTGAIRTRATLIAWKDGKPVYAASCCDDVETAGRQQATLIGYKNGQPVYSFHCCVAAGSAGSASAGSAGSGSAGSAAGSQAVSGLSGSGISGSGSGAIIFDGCCPGGVPATLFGDGTFDTIYGLTCACDDFTIVFNYSPTGGIIYTQPTFTNVWIAELDLDCGLHLYLELTCGTIFTEEENFIAYLVSGFLQNEGEEEICANLFESGDISYQCEPFLITVQPSNIGAEVETCDPCDVPSNKVVIDLVIRE